mgnify:CR=1 FL=1
MNESELYVKKFLALLGVISVLALTGCGRIDSAATIGDVTISQADAQAVVDEVLAERTKVDTSQMQLETGDELTRGQLRFKILMHTFDEIAKELDLEITTSQVVSRKQQISQSLGGDAELPKNLVNAAIAPQDFDTYIRAILISERITSALAQSGVPEAEVPTQLGKLLSAKAKELGVKINPRYGFWDVEAGDVVAADVTGGAVTPSSK